MEGKSAAEVLLRSDDSSKMKLKEKFVAVLEAVFRGDDPSGGRGQAFWDEVLLLRVNAPCLARCVALVSEETLLRHGPATRLLLAQCVRVVAAGDEMRAANGLLIAELFFRHLFRKKFSNFGFDVLNLVGGGFEAGDALFRQLVDAVLQLLADDSRPAKELALAVELLLSLVSGCDNVAANSLIEYLHNDRAFEVLMVKLPLNSRADGDIVFRALLVSLLIANYQKYETRNVFVGHFAALANPEVQEVLARVIRDQMVAVREVVEARLGPAPAASSSSSWWSAAVAPVQPKLPTETVRCLEGGALLACYELNYLSRDFFLRTLLESHGVGWGDRQQIKGTVPIGPDVLRAHVELASALCIKVADERGALHCKMAFLAFTPFLEDSASLEVLHNPKFAWSTPLLIQRKTENSAIVGVNKDHDIPPICWILDVLLEFVKNNIHVNLQWELLWKQMFRLLGFVAKDDWFRKPETIELAMSITTILNLFITYGDTFLPSGNDYDYLYYELIREAKTLSAVTLLIEKYAADSALAQHMENISAIIAHFRNRIQNWIQNNDGAVISPEDVLSVIKRNYGSLKLTLLEGLDFYSPYSENPSQISFFSQYIRVFVGDTKATIKN